MGLLLLLQRPRAHDDFAKGARLRRELPSAVGRDETGAENSAQGVTVIVVSGASVSNSSRWLRSPFVPS